jgi:hypothetical protein
VILTICIIVYLSSLFLRPLHFDAQPITPKNIFLITYGFKLAIVPLTLIFYGFVDNPIFSNKDDIGYGVYINVISYVSLCTGFILFNSYNSSTDFKTKISRIELRVYNSRQYIIGTFLVVVLFSIFYRFYNISLADLITTKNSEEQDPTENSLFSLISNIGRFAFPFLIILLFTDKRLISKSSITKIVAWTVLVCSGLIGTIGSNRANILYMLVCIAAAFSIRVRRIPFYIIIVFVLTIGPYIINFNQARASADIETFNENLKEINKDAIVSTLQIYFQAPSTIINLNAKNESKDHFTLFNSFFESFPYLGKTLRDKSGSYYYNMYIYHSNISRDQVYPFGAEVEKNLGLIGTVLIYFLAGGVFNYFNKLYTAAKQIEAPVLIIFSIIYISTYLNAVNLLSVSVLGQFIFYNSFPIVVILLFSKTSRISG